MTKYNLGPHIRFNKQVDECKWDSDEQLYRIKLSDSGFKSAGAKSEDKARVVISAIGGLLDPRLPPDLPGREVFKGDMWHSGRWNHDISLSGKKVGVIGNGCSAVQFLPVISEDASTEIVNFCRSPHWMVPLVISRFPAFDPDAYLLAASVQHRTVYEMDVQLCSVLPNLVPLYDLLSGETLHRSSCALIAHSVRWT